MIVLLQSKLGSTRSSAFSAGSNYFFTDLISHKLGTLGVNYLQCARQVTCAAYSVFGLYSCNTHFGSIIWMCNAGLCQRYFGWICLRFIPTHCYIVACESDIGITFTEVSNFTQRHWILVILSCINFKTLISILVISWDTFFSASKVVVFSCFFFVCRQWPAAN